MAESPTLSMMEFAVVGDKPILAMTALGSLRDEKRTVLGESSRTGYALKAG